VLQAAAGSEPPTYFEALTVAALLAFRRHGVELAVLEVGLGGRLDATNATEPLLSLVCEIGLDHVAILGPTLAEVAREKAGIFRRGRPAIAAPAAPEAARALERAAAEVGAELTWLERPVLPAEPLPLAGPHQRRNAALAAAGARRLRDAGFHRLDEGAIAAGLRGCRWPGRLETVAPPGRPPILLDGAHNPPAAESLREALRSTGRPDLLFGALADKDAAAMLAVLRPAVGEVYLAPPANPRARPIADLLTLPAAAGAHPFATAAEALDAALAAGAPLLVTGSIFLVGEVRKLLRLRFGQPPPAAEVATYAPALAGSR
jgi:dihydrofolate synthase / folylpolyglutamate synthase